MDIKPTISIATMMRIKRLIAVFAIMSYGDNKIFVLGNASKYMYKAITEYKINMQT
jgi:hypothetical protein